MLSVIVYEFFQALKIHSNILSGSVFMCARAGAHTHTHIQGGGERDREARTLFLEVMFGTHTCTRRRYQRH